MAGHIIREKKTDNFVILDKTCLLDPNLSFKAKGLHSYLMQLPSDWSVNISDLKNRSKDGRDGVSTAMQELIEAGYVTRQIAKEEKTGVFCGYDYFVFETAQPVSAKAVYGKAVNGKTVYGKAVTNKNYINQELKEVSIKKEKEENEIQKENQITDLIEKSVEWIRTGGAATVRSWADVARFRGDIEEQAGKFWMHRNNVPAERSHIWGDPLPYFKVGFPGWLMNANQFKPKEQKPAGATVKKISPYEGVQRW